MYICQIPIRNLPGPHGVHMKSAVRPAAAENLPGGQSYVCIYIYIYVCIHAYSIYCMYI